MPKCAASSTHNSTGFAPGNPWRFRPGQSGNPEGRRREQAPVRDLARTHTAEAIQALVEITTSRGYKAADRVDAARTLLEFGWGKPPVAVFEAQAQEGITWEGLLEMVAGEEPASGSSEP